ncbi:MAG: putative glycoside hydrolase, partial [bacterium]
MQKLRFSLMVVCVSVIVSIATPGECGMPFLGKARKAGGDYPRIATLWGTGSQEENFKDYDVWARYDLLILMGSEWKKGKPTRFEDLKKFREEVARRHPGILILGTAPLINIPPPGRLPWMKDEWFVRFSNGKKISWWADQVYVGNVLRDDYQEGLLNFIEGVFGRAIQARLIDGIMFDSVVGGLSWLTRDADTNLDGKADDIAEVDTLWVQAQNRFLEKLRKRFPGIKIHVNDVDERHSPFVNGRYFEGRMLLDRMVRGAASPQDVIQVLNNWNEHGVQPGDTIATMTHPLGWQGWRAGYGKEVTRPAEVDLVKRDFTRMRLGLLTTLMTDAYFEYDLGTVWWGNPAYWFAEFDAPLGRPLGPGREVLAGTPGLVL